ncbi:uncharacterized protein VTP21DRAFT_868 [Calcarisporiella thermophila]|uniref:uncharacterized protein n=1 Tax=Calcarisporiella thermophila TaxID=911321 RepID=UPI003741EE2D
MGTTDPTLSTPLIFSDSPSPSSIPSRPILSRIASPNQRPETYGSRTMTLHPEELEENGQGSEEGTPQPPEEVGTLRLSGAPANSGRKVKWSEDVVDNEHLGKKKSKICCIYRRPHAFDESSEDESSGSDSDHDCDGHGHGHHHNHKRTPRSSSPNAYERQPRYSKDKKGKTPANQNT